MAPRLRGDTPAQLIRGEKKRSPVERESKTRRRHQGAGSQAAPPPGSEHLWSVLISLVEFPAIQTSFQMMER